MLEDDRRRMNPLRKCSVGTDLHHICISVDARERYSPVLVSEKTLAAADEQTMRHGFLAIKKSAVARHTVFGVW